MSSDAPAADHSDHETPGPIPGLAKTYWVALCTPVESAVESDIAATLPTHLAWLRSVEDRDKLLMAGPLMSGPGVRMGSGIMIFRAQDEAEAQAIAEQDPFVVAGLRNNVVYRWLLNEGSVSLRVSLSNGNYDWR